MDVWTASRATRAPAPDSVLADITSPADLEQARRHGHLWVVLANDVPVGFAHVEILGFEVIPPEELSSALRSVVDDETRRGLDRTRRVAMRRRSAT